MPTPAVTLRIRKFRRRFGILAPKVVVRSQLPMRWYVLLTVLFALLMLSLGWLMAQRSETNELGRELEASRQQLILQSDELSALRSSSGTEQSVVNIERAARQQLLSRIKVLESENVMLKEDVLLFERLISAANEAATVRIENFKAVADVGGRYRYRLLMIYQPDKQLPEFRGFLQLEIQYVHSGRSARMLVPEMQALRRDGLVEVRHILRREGGFVLPAGAVLQGVEARLYQGDVLKSKRMAQL
ncbi:MAG TPA: DUF6776 family protein [Azonexus sp.]|nr:DUF6776 family protein [Azonexus sp.]